LDSLAFGLLALQLVSGCAERADVLLLLRACSGAEDMDEAVELVVRSAAGSAEGQGWAWPQELLGPLAQLALECADATPEWRPSLEDVCPSCRAS